MSHAFKHNYKSEATGPDIGNHPNAKICKRGRARKNFGAFAIFSFLWSFLSTQHDQLAWGTHTLHQEIRTRYFFARREVT